VGRTSKQPGGCPPWGGGAAQHGRDRHWGHGPMLRHPYLGIEACESLVASGIGLVGTDAFNVDSTVQRTTQAHEILLGHDVLIVENLVNLSRLCPGRVYECAFAPLKLRGAMARPFAPMLESTEPQRLSGSSQARRERPDRETSGRHAGAASQAIK
jgi:hypothetical protein